MDVSVEAQCEAATIEYWFHVSPPLDNWSVYEVLTDGLIAAKAERRAALAAGDHDRRVAADAEIIDLTYIAAAAAEGLALQRIRFMTGNHAWPLGVLLLKACCNASLLQRFNGAMMHVWQTS